MATRGFWYWFKEGDISPWYSSVRVRRQAIGQSWRDLVGSCVDEIAGFLSRR